MKSFYSSVTILLILVAALLNPAAAADRKLRKSGDGNRKLMNKDAKCMKNTKDSCIGIVMEGTLYGKRKGQAISYGNGRDSMSMSYGPGPATKAIAVGTQWIGRGRVADPDELTEDGEIDVNNDPYVNEDYYYYKQCTVLEGRIASNGKFGLQGGKVPFVCNIDICYGIWSEEGVNVADCVVLRGLTNGRLDASSKIESLSDVDDFTAAVIGGTGRFTGVIGIGQVFPGPAQGGFPDRRGWQIDLDVSVSPWYQDVPLPPKLDFSAVPP